jgi:hypothetical protein
VYQFRTAFCSIWLLASAVRADEMSSTPKFLVHIETSGGAYAPDEFDAPVGDRRYTLKFEYPKVQLSFYLINDCTLGVILDADVLSTTPSPFPRTLSAGDHFAIELFFAHHPNMILRGLVQGPEKCAAVGASPNNRWRGP